MKLFSFRVLLFCFLFSCGTEHGNNEKFENIEGVANNGVHYDSIFSSIDSLEYIQVKALDTYTIHNAYKKDVTVVLFRQNNIAKKLTYTILGEDSCFNENGCYYFDDSGLLIGNKINGDVKYNLNYFVVFEKASTSLYHKNNNGIEYNQLDDIAAASKVSIACRQVSSLMQFFGKTHYVNLIPKRKSIATLRTFGKVELKNKPYKSASTIAVLDDNSHLIYLGSDNVTDTVNEKAWIWYNVVTTDSAIGWVFGHPKFVDDLNDDNYNE
jgi:hypothetical protein